MRFFILFVFSFFTQVSFAKSTLIADCSHLESASKAQFVLFNKKEFIELGECLAIYTAKNQHVKDLSMMCDEVTENASNPFGIMSLTKLEAIYIGQCVGTINYIYQRYNNELLVSRRGYRSSEKYSCYKGVEAVDILRKNASDSMSRNEIRALLCHAR